MTGDIKWRWKYAGVASVELAILLPLLIFLTLALFDLARAIQAQLILVNISREGASLSSRLSLEFTNQQIMGALSSTTPPLDMTDDGMIYITQVIGYQERNKDGEKVGGVQNLVVGQYRWVDGWNHNHYSPRSEVWNCGQTANTKWLVDGSCGNIPSPGPVADVMTDQLAEGDLIYCVETFYRFKTIFGDMNLGFGLRTPKIGPDLYSMTVL